MSNEQEFAFPTASTSASATNILDLNYDCLREIFLWERFSILDLCSIVETHSCFRQVVDGGFPKQFKKFVVNLTYLSSTALQERKRILSNFGHKISDLEFSGVKLNDHVNALKNTFPKLERFTYSYYGDDGDVFNDSIGNDFFSRHQNLKALSLGRRRGTSHLLPIVADNCKQLAELDIDIGWDKKQSLKKGLSSILSLDHLKKLKMDCGPHNITKFIQELRHSNSLEFLALRRVQCDSEFISALLKLTRLQVLALEDCRGLTINSLADLKPLTDLKIVKHPQVLDLDLVRVIKQLINLKTLHFRAENFELDQQTYLRIVDVVRGRPATFPDALQITCRTANRASANSFGDENSRKIVKINQL